MADATGVQTQQIAQYTQWATTAQAFVNDLQQFLELNSVTIEGLPDPQYLLRNPLDAIQAFLVSQKPSRASIRPLAANLPTSPTLQTTSVTAFTVPDFTSTAPDISIPSAPTMTMPASPNQPSLDDVPLPTAPTLVFPSAPALSSLSFPETPSIQLPSFTATAPVDDLLAPSNTFNFAEVDYQSALLDAEKAKLLDNLVNGGYGIETADEQGLLQRERDRETEITLAAVDEVFRAGASRGFPLPPGELNVATQRAQQAMQDKLSTVSRDIAIRRGDLFVDNRKFTIEQVRALETTLLNYHNAVMERTLNAQKATIDAAIAVFDALVRRFNARLDAYKTQASVFESQIRAALTQAEIYRAQISAVEVQAN